MLNTVALDGVAFHHFLAAHSHFLDNNTQLIVHNDGPPPSHFCRRRISGNDLLHYFYYASAKPTVSPLLFPVTSRNLLSLQSLPHSIPYRQDNVRRRKDAYRVGTAARGSRERLSRLP